MKELCLAGQLDTDYSRAMNILCILMQPQENIAVESMLTTEVVQLTQMIFVGSAGVGDVFIYEDRHDCLIRFL